MPAIAAPAPSAEPTKHANSQVQRIERRAREAGARVAALERSITDKLERPDATDTLRWRLRATGQAWRRALASLEHRVFQALRRTMIWFRVRDRLRRGQRRRQVLAYLKGAQNQTRAELASSAMLAVLTERIARAGATEISADEIAETVAQAEGIVVGYQGQIAQIEPLLAKARIRTERWVHWSSVAEARGSPELVAKARAYREACEGDERELVKAIEDCQAGCRRLRDAIEQVQALAQRSVTAAPTTGRG